MELSRDRADFLGTRKLPYPIVSFDVCITGSWIAIEVASDVSVDHGTSNGAGIGLAFSVPGGYRIPRIIRCMYHGILDSYRCGFRCLGRSWYVKLCRDRAGFVGAGKLPYPTVSINVCIT